MSIPSYATSMVSNYKRMYQEKYGCMCTLSDEVVWDICNTIFDDSSSTLQDEARVDVMFEREHG